MSQGVRLGQSEVQAELLRLSPHTPLQAAVAVAATPLEGQVEVSQVLGCYQKPSQVVQQAEVLVSLATDSSARGVASVGQVVVETLEEWVVLVVMLAGLVAAAAVVLRAMLQGQALVVLAATDMFF